MTRFEGPSVSHSVCLSHFLSLFFDSSWTETFWDENHFNQNVSTTRRVIQFQASFQAQSIHEYGRATFKIASREKIDDYSFAGNESPAKDPLNDSISETESLLLEHFSTLFSDPWNIYP